MENLDKYVSLRSWLDKLPEKEKNKQIEIAKKNIEIISNHLNKKK